MFESILNFLWNNAWEITGFILGIGFIGVFAAKFRNLLRQAAEVFIAIDDALADSKISKEEIEKIKKEALDVWDAVKQFKSK